MRVSALQVIRELKEQRKLERQAQREQDKQNRRLARKGLISSPARLTILDEKTLSQMDAARLLECVIDQWRNK